MVKDHVWFGIGRFLYPCNSHHVSPCWWHYEESYYDTWVPVFLITAEGIASPPQRITDSTWTRAGEHSTPTPFLLEDILNPDVQAQGR